jgi:hypothetical protein
MDCFLSGLVFCGLALMASYLTHLRLYTDSRGRADHTSLRPLRWLSLASLLCLLRRGGHSPLGLSVPSSASHSVREGGMPQLTQN